LAAAVAGKERGMAVGESRTFTRSEEELSLEGRRVRTVKRVRIRKRIVEDWIEVRVPVRREELEVIEEEVPADAADSADSELDPLSEQTLELVLLEEEPVVTTRVVARERVTVTRHIVEDVQEVSDTLRKEVIEMEELPPRS